MRRRAYLIIWIMLSGIIYFWLGDGWAFIRSNLYAFFGEALIFPLGLLIWLAFFAQFVLPVRTFRDRQKIFDRLLAHRSRAHGPAIFVENGTPVQHFGEGEKGGPGVIWLDSASAAVTRTPAAFKQVLGPGVHFTERNETLDQENVVDLHPQLQKLGPRDDDDVFAPKPDDGADTFKIEKYRETQNRRQAVSAWTRDGIEVVPNVTVIFKIDAPPVKGEEAGSRFGFDAEAVLKAVTGEGNALPTGSVTSAKPMGWNNLPALLAVDLWREYLGKFTLAQLFEADQSLPPEPSKPSVPILAETQALFQPTSLTSSGGLAGILHELNALLARLADRCEFKGKYVIKVRPEIPKPAISPSSKEAEQMTALQIINHMLKARMTKAEVPFLDDSGQAGSGMITSPEYQLLQERGLKIIAVSVGGLRFAPTVEEQLVRQWSANWLDNARTERERVERRRSFVELEEKVEAVGAYARLLSLNLLKINPGQKNQKGTLKTLLLRTRDELVRNDRLHHRAGLEREALEEIIQWMERNES
jgi:hypothetical protein